MRRFLTAALALILAMHPFPAMAEVDEEKAIQEITTLVKTALKSENLSYDYSGGDYPYFSIPYEAEDNRLGDIDAYVDIYPWGVILWTCYTEPVPEDRIDEVIRYMNLINSNLLYEKYYLHADSGTICYELPFFMNYKDLRDFEFTYLINFLNAHVADFDYDVEYFAAVIDGLSAENAFAMYQADYDDR